MLRGAACTSCRRVRLSGYWLPMKGCHVTDNWVLLATDIGCDLPPCCAAQEKHMNMFFGCRGEPCALHHLLKSDLVIGLAFGHVAGT